MSYLIFIAILPVILLISYINKYDKNREPKELVKKIFKYGALSVIPVLIFELLLDSVFPTDSYDNLYSLFISVFCGVALIEEFFKWLVVKHYNYNSSEFDEVYDAIVYTTYSSLGFACIENIFYVIPSGFTTGLLRALVAVPGHCCFGVLMGYYFGLAKKNASNGNKINEKKYLVLSIVIPTLLHALYDFFIFSENDTLFGIWCFYVVGLFIASTRIIKYVSSKGEYVNSNITNNTSKYCSNCGRECNTNYCSNCGYKNK